MIDKLLAEVDSLASERNVEVLKQVRGRLKTSCRFIANFFRLRKLIKRAIKLRYMESVAQYRHASRRHRHIGTVEEIQAQILDVEKLIAECRDVINSTTPCKVCVACESTTNRRRKKEHTWGCRKKTWVF